MNTPLFARNVPRPDMKLASMGDCYGDSYADSFSTDLSFELSGGFNEVHPCRGTSLIRHSTPLGPYSTTMPRALSRSCGGCFL
jgi:hypothetical protein